MKTKTKHFRLIAMLLAVLMLFGALAVVATASQDNVLDTQWYTVTHNSESDSIDIVIKTDLKEYTEIRPDDLKELFNHLKDVLVDVIVEDVKAAHSVSTFALRSRAISDLFDSAELLKTYLAELSIHTPEDVKNINKETLAQMLYVFEVTEEQFNNVDIVEVFEEHADELIEAGVLTEEDVYAGEPDPETGKRPFNVELESALVDKKTEVVEKLDEYETIVENGGTVEVDYVEIAVHAVLPSIVDVILSTEVDGVLKEYDVYHEGYFVTSAMKQMVQDVIPLSFAELSEITEIDESFGVLFKTGYGDIDFTLNFKVDGDISRITSVFDVVDEYVDIGRDSDGTINLDLRVPEKFANALLRLCETDRISDSTKLKVFSVLMDDVDNAYGLFDNLTFDEIIEILEKINFEGILDKEQIKKYIDLTHLTNEEIVEKVAQYEEYYNKACRVIAKLYGKLPDRFKSATIAQLYDGNGVFSASVDETVNIEKMLEKVVPERAATLAAFIDIVEINVKARATVTFEDIRKVQYVVDGDPVLTAFLPEGADVAFFADMTVMPSGDPILFWLDENGEAVTKMPARDIVLTASAGLDVTVTDDVIKTYDGTDSFITAAPLYEHVGATYTYQWYKDGEAIDGATAATIAVKNVLDSGEYYCVVTVNNGWTNSTRSDNVKVEISPATIDLSHLCWDYSGPYYYTGSYYEPKLDLSAFPSDKFDINDFTFTYTGNTRECEPNQNYVVNVEITLADTNYEVVADIDALTWAINKAQIDFTGVAWSANSFTYDGTAKNVTLVGLPNNFAVQYGGDADKIEVGTYTTTFTYDTDHYELINSTVSASHTWTIDKIVIDFAGVAWSANSFTYDGTAKNVTLVGLPNNFAVQYGGDADKIEVGTYTTTFTYDTAHYELINSTVSASHTWTINKAVIDFAGVAWSADSFTYDGTAKNVTLVGVPNNFVVQYGGDVDKIVVGTYTTSFAYDTDHYELINNTVPASHTWTINKAVIDFTGVAWNYTSAFVYDKTEKSVALVGVPTGFAVTYTGDAAKTNAGTYTVSFAYDTDNYEVINNTAPLTLEWTIDKATYDMSGVTFDDMTVVFNGAAHSIAVSGTLPEGVTVQYSEAKTAVGVYTMTATFSGDFENYNEIAPMTATLTITVPIVPTYSFVIRDGDGNIIIEVKVEGGIGSDHNLNLKDVTFNYTDVDISKLLEEGKVGVLANAYDIHFAKGGSQVSLTDNFEVKLLVPESLRSKDLVVVYIDDNGNVTNMNAVREGDYVLFDTTHFSVYALFEIQDAKETGDGGANWLWLIILLIVLAVLLIAALIIFLVLRKKKAPTEPTDADSEPVDTTPEPVDPINEESLEEPVAEEPAVEEVVVAEPEVVEPVVDEAVAEEPVVAEPEIVEPAAEEPVVEEVAVAEPVIVPSILDSDAILVRYRSSYMSRLIQSEPPVQDYYTVIKNKILSYDGVKARTSWNFESFNKGRIQCVKLDVKGKALVVYLALDPAEYNEDKYHFVDVSAKPKLDQVPMMLKVRSARALGYAIELIEEVMNKLGIEELENPVELDYHMPYETTEALVEKELVKVILPKGVKLDENSTVGKADVGEIIDNANAEAEARAAEEPAVEEVVVAEPPVVEPIVDEAVAEEPEVVEPATAEPVVVPAIPDSDAILVRYRSSYMSRLIQAEEPVQDYYNVIKNKLLSYKGVKARMSWNFESFNKGRVQCVKLNVKGKALIMYLALNPNEYNEGKYHFTDVSDKPKLDQVPMMLKIRSARALGYAVELIEELMKQFEIEPLAKPKEVDYHMPYETTEALVEKELIKVILPKGVKLDASSTVGKADVGEIIDNANAEAEARATEEPVTEEPAVEEAVPESPAVEEPAVEEPIFEEIVHVNSVEADMIVTDSKAEEIIEHVAKAENVVKGSGKMCEINLDTICDSFDDGDTVTLAELKKRRLINAKAGRLKVLARGVMSKTLVIYADKFSLQAVKMITLAGGHAKQID